ncbi:unnamed protein product [Adineta steineri]|uniref:Ubiquitin thioesterase OTU n=1 Tax=Adineta steineri TaxID=433720 RepID=A0A818TPL4_9BILA|nr:unnamed protein product [Adineta steineri]CAF3689994.1 unnamed protein product [Adineta steineri]
MLNSATISALPHEFRRGQVPVDSSSLLSSIRYVNNTNGTSNNKTLRNFVAERIFKNENLRTAILGRQTNCTTAAQYREQIKKGQLHDGAIEIKVLSNLCDLLIRVVSMKENHPDSTNLPYLEYGDDAKTTNKCVYILYDEEAKHYDPLYIVNKDNPDEKLTIFERDNTETSDLLRTFIQEKLHTVNFKELDCCIASHIMESPTKKEDLIEDELLMGMITSMAAETSSPIERNDRSKNITVTNRSLPIKRTYRNYDELTYGQHTEQELSSNQINDREAKHAKIDEDELLKSNKTNSEFITFEELFQTNLFNIESESQIEQQSTMNSPAAVSQPIKMRLKVKLAKKFRGRTRGDFIPKKKRNRKNEPSKPRPPRYFSDRNGKTYLNLLIPKRILPNNLHQMKLELAMISKKIDGYSYINTYFKFMEVPSNPLLSPLRNPMYMPVDHAELSSYSDTLYQLKLRLVVVTHTIGELMESEQPLTIFLSPKNNNGQKAITTPFKKQKPFKNAYDLHKMRFAITLWTKQHGEKEFKRREDIQYISSISTEDRKYVAPNNSRTRHNTIIVIP